MDEAVAKLTGGPDAAAADAARTLLLKVFATIM